MLIWTDNAISHITEFIKDAKTDKEEIAKNYMNKLVDYVYTLENMNEMGKDFEYVVSNYKLRQLIYKKHRIIYTIKNDDVVILAVLHTKLDIEKALKKLKRDRYIINKI